MLGRFFQLVSPIEKLTLVADEKILAVYLFWQRK